MDYDQLLKQPPFGVDQKTKELWYCEMFEKLVKDHEKRCEKYRYFIEAMKMAKTYRSIEEIPMLPVGLFKDRKSVV